LNFFKTIREYKLTIKKNIQRSSFQRHTYTVTLQKQHQQNQLNEKNEKYRDRKYVCKETYLFKECF
jgi:hypothetical protein